MRKDIATLQLRAGLESFVMGGVFVPPHIHDALIAYIVNHRKPGRFLCAVFQNDLAAAISSADEINLSAIRVIMGFVHNQAPGTCWGSVKNFKNWINTEENEDDCD